MNSHNIMPYTCHMQDSAHCHLQPPKSGESSTNETAADSVDKKCYTAPVIVTTDECKPLSSCTHQPYRSESLSATPHHKVS